MLVSFVFGIAVRVALDLSVLVVAVSSGGPLSSVMDLSSIVLVNGLAFNQEIVEVVIYHIEIIL